MRSRLLLWLATLIVSATAEANCAVMPKHPGRLVVESCEVIDTLNYPYVGLVASCLKALGNYCQALDMYTGVIIHTMDEEFFFKDASQTACDLLEAGDILQANVERECCDGGGMAPCDLGFDTYITDYEEEQ